MQIGGYKLASAATDCRRRFSGNPPSQAMTLAMGWLRLVVSSLKLFVSFAEYRLFWLSGTTPLPSDDTSYGVATISQLLKITGLSCRISSLSLGSFAKETYSSFGLEVQPPLQATTLATQFTRNHH